LCGHNAQQRGLPKPCLKNALNYRKKTKT